MTTALTSLGLDVQEALEFIELLLKMKVSTPYVMELERLEDVGVAQLIWAIREQLI